MAKEHFVGEKLLRHMSKSLFSSSLSMITMGFLSGKGEESVGDAVASTNISEPFAARNTIVSAHTESLNGL